MRKFLLLIVSLLLLFVSCCPASIHNDESRSEPTYLGKIFHLGNGCVGHDFYVSKLEFEQDGHQIWVFTFPNDYSNDIICSILHSPECKKCNSEPKSILDESLSSPTNSWGW